MLSLILYCFTFYIALVNSVNIKQNDITQNEVYQIVTNSADLYNLNLNQMKLNNNNYDIEINKNVDITLNEFNNTMLNMMVIGRSGVGKSVLINSLFDFDEAEDNIGLPITNEIKLFHKKGFPFTLYDTPGLELNEQQRNVLIKNITGIIEEGFKSNDINKQIHCILYCIKCCRIEPEEVQFIKNITNVTNINQVPVIIVITYSTSEKKSKDFKNSLENMNLNVVDIVPVLAKDEEIDDNYTKKAYGLNNLLKSISEKLPEQLQITLQRIQKINLDLKIEKAKNVVVMASISDTIVSTLSPILLPPINYVSLISINAVMIAKITYIFDFDLLSLNDIKSITNNIFNLNGKSALKESISSNLYKFTPLAIKLVTKAYKENLGKNPTNIYVSLIETINNSILSTGKEPFEHINVKEISITLNNGMNGV